MSARFVVSETPAALPKSGIDNNNNEVRGHSSEIAGGSQTLESFRVAVSQVERNHREHRHHPFLDGVLTVRSATVPRRKRDSGKQVLIINPPLTEMKRPGMRVSNFSLLGTHAFGSHTRDLLRWMLSLSRTRLLRLAQPEYVRST